MLKTKKSKSHKMRGTNSHGWGHKKKHRGSGHRGGFGLAGTGSRGDSQKSGLMAGSSRFIRKVAASKKIKMSEVKTGFSYFGKYGFKSIKKEKNKVLSISFIETNFDKLVENDIIVKEKTEYIFDTTLKYSKILGNGKFSKKLTLICKDISENAKKKIEDVGGKVIIKNNKLEEVEKNE